VGTLGDKDTRDLAYQILKIKLKDVSEEYILDLSGAQYGYHDPVIWGAHYSRTRVSEFARMETFGASRDFLLANRHIPGHNEPNLGPLPKILHV
jgi:hypothetical protein